MNMDMKKKPPHFDKVQEYYVDKEEDAETATPPPSREESPETPEVKLPTMLPPDYDLLLKENGITEETRPVSAPCFNGAPDPSGRMPWLGLAVR